MKTFFSTTPNQRPIDVSIDTLDSLNIKQPGELVNTKLSDNKFNLAQAIYTPYTTTAQDTYLCGNSTRMAGLTANHRVYVHGVHFIGPVNINAAGKALFSNCTFDLQVLVANGGRAAFTNCKFLANVNHPAGPVGDVGILGCLRLGAVHVGCTILFEIT